VARTSAVEYERVAAACSSLFLDGRSPSFESVYELIGRKGGAKVVQGMISDWRKEIAGRFMAGRTNPDLSDDLISEADRMLTVVWRLALEKADAAYADERAQITQWRVEMTERVAEAQERAGASAREALALQGETQTLQARLQANHAEIEDLRQRLADTTTLLRARDEQIGQLREDGARLASTLESERRNQEAELLAERERHEEALTVVCRFALAARLDATDDHAASPASLQDLDRLWYVLAGDDDDHADPAVEDAVHFAHR
jgi:hypothetical protein